MKQYTKQEARAILFGGKGINHKWIICSAPITGQPSRNPPFRAIVEAAGIPGKTEGRGKLTRRRFIRLVMSTGNQRREAEVLAWAAHRNGIPYREILLKFLVPAIIHADEVMDTLQHGKVDPESITIMQ